MKKYAKFSIPFIILAIFLVSFIYSIFYTLIWRIKKLENELYKWYTPS